MTKNKLTLIKRSTPTCPACNTMELMLKGADISFDEIDIAKDTEAIEKYDLSSVPVLLIHDNNGEYTRLNGIQPVEVIKEFLED